MPLIHFRNILSCSSEDRIHCSENLLKPEKYKKWLSTKGIDEQITCILELEKSSLISSIDIGNDGSSFIELFVSRSSKSDEWIVLLPATPLMTPSESRSNTNRNQVKLLKSTDLTKTCLNEKWDRLKIVCEQKFNRVNQFGLCFIKLYSPSTLSDETNHSESSINVDKQDEEDETGNEQSKIGSFFAKKQAEKKLKNLEPSASDQIRALSNVAEELLSKKPMNDSEIQSLLNKDVQTPSSSKRRLSSDEPKSSNEIKRIKNTDKSQLMKDVTFVLSGFQNPLRSELRNKATVMGAIYNDDWDETCTHLICAFPNTPKFTQVEQTGQGTIVNKQWILDCYKQNQLLLEKNYEFKRNDNNTPKRKMISFDDDEEENGKPVSSKDVQRKTSIKKKITTFDDDDEEDEEPVVSKDVIKKSANKNNTTTFDDDQDVYDADTDEDEGKPREKSFELANFFSGKHFYVLDGDYDDDTFHDIRRVIYAYDGILEKQMTSDIKYIITNRMWNQEFEKMSKTNLEIKFLTLDWLQDCHGENKLVPCQPYLIIP